MFWDIFMETSGAIGFVVLSGLMIHWMVHLKKDRESSDS